MAALAKKTTTHKASAWRGRVALRAADEADAPRGSAVHSQQARLRAAFAPDETHAGYPGPVKALILVGLPAAFWIGVFALVARLAHG